MTTPMNHPASCEVLVKIGGSILDDEEATARLVPQLTSLAGRRRFLILTGGGRAAKRIKANQRAQQTPFYGCWKAGVLSLEVNAALLASYSTSFSLVASLADLNESFEAGKIPILGPAGVITSSLHLTPDWNVTTDSMGLYFASMLGAQRYVVVSDVHGIYEGLPADVGETSPIPRLDVDELSKLPSSKMDPAFIDYFRRYALPTIVVNGKYPARVNAAIRGQPTLGTEILSDDARNPA